MPSIQDVADQINAKLDSIVLSTQNTATNTAQIENELNTLNGKVDALDAHMQAGHNNLAAGLFAIWEAQKVTNSILAHQSKQLDTVICLLENNNELLCDITRKMTKQLETQEAILVSTRRVEGIQERVHCSEAGDYDRMLKTNERIEECCPPEPVKEEPCPEGCAVPKPRIYKPKGQGWKHNIDPIG